MVVVAPRIACDRAIRLRTTVVHRDHQRTHGSRYRKRGISPLPGATFEIAHLTGIPVRNPVIERVGCLHWAERRDASQHCAARIGLCLQSMRKPRRRHECHVRLEDATSNARSSQCRPPAVSRRDRRTRCACATARTPTQESAEMATGHTSCAAETATPRASMARSATGRGGSATSARESGQASSSHNDSIHTPSRNQPPLRNCSREHVPCTPIPTNAVDARGELQGIDETALACEQTAERRCHSALTRNAQFSGEAQIANCSTQNGGRRTADAERLDAERLDAERLDAERLNAERLNAELLDAERLDAERLDAERQTQNCLAQGRTRPKKQL